jgi:hypothetical protein
MDEHEGAINRRKALGKFGQFGLAATAMAGAASLFGKTSTAEAATCGGERYIWVKSVGCCGSGCQSGFWCYRQYDQNTGQFIQARCCQASGQNILCSCNAVGYPYENCF